jgi:hypothetical protein
VDYAAEVLGQYIPEYILENVDPAGPRASPSRQKIEGEIQLCVTLILIDQDILVLTCTLLE